MAKVAINLVKELRDRTGLGMMECKRALVDCNGNIEKAIDELRKTSGLKAAKKAGRTAAEGVIGIKTAGSYGVICEINSETDFVARDENFNNFVEAVLESIFDNKTTDLNSLFSKENLEDARQALIQKIGENVLPRRASSVEAPIIGSYLHSNNKIGVLVGLRGENHDLAQDLAMHIAAVNPVVVESKDMPSDLLAAEEEIYAAQAKETGKSDKIIEKMVSGRLKKFLKENSLMDQPFVKDGDITVGELVKSHNVEVMCFERFEVGEGVTVEEVDFAAEVAEQLKNST